MQQSKNILMLSKLYMPTLKEDPADADIASHRLLLRSGMIRKTASGVYTFLPLGQRVLAKVEAIVRSEMDAAGAQEIMMPALQPAELWHESGRWNNYGPELMRLTDRHDHGFCLGPTHEELITDLIKGELRSYKQLPVNLYQIQVKFRDEIRPRFGLLRSREFIMKDAYSFHDSQESLQETYDEMSQAYANICNRCGLEWRSVEADGGQIGGSVTREFMALAESGEAELVYCDCGYAADSEAGECIPSPIEYPYTSDANNYEGAEGIVVANRAADGRIALTEVETPDAHTIDELAEFLSITADATVKAFSCKDDQGEIYVLFVPGDHEVNEIKAERIVEGFIPLTDEEMVTAGLHKGSMGPVGLPEGVKIVADRSLQAVATWVVGANVDGRHFIGAAPGRDFQVDTWEDLCMVAPGDKCPKCGAALQGARGIEVSQVFQLGDKYSKSMNATYLDADGKEQYFIMGCYGVGVTRTLASIVEQNNDEAGIKWPFTVAPAHICIIPLDVKPQSEVLACAIDLANKFSSLGFEVAIDDRSERPGVKFADADLVGWPLQIIVGKRGLENNTVEVKRRRSGERKDLSLDILPELMAFAKRNASGLHYGGYNTFDALFSKS
jgi:prolyl-tRNA synthetase